MKWTLPFGVYHPMGTFNCSQPRLPHPATGCWFQAWLQPIPKISIVRDHLSLSLGRPMVAFLSLWCDVPMQHAFDSRFPVSLSNTSGFWTWLRPNGTTHTQPQRKCMFILYIYVYIYILNNNYIHFAASNESKAFQTSFLCSASHIHRVPH